VGYSCSTPISHVPNSIRKVNNPVPGANCETQNSGTKQERLGESVTMTLVPLFFIVAVNKNSSVILSDRYNCIMDGGNISDSVVRKFSAQVSVE